MTYGVGADVAYIITAVDTYDASFKSYPEILAHLTNLNVCNLGYPAATSEEIMAKQEGRIAKKQSAEESALDQRLVEHGVKNATRNGAQDVLVIEIGSNGGWDGDYDTLVAQYRTMIDRSGCSNFLVLGDTDDPGTSEGDVNQGPLYDTGAFSETQWETALREAFGDHFVNVRQYLIVNGLNVTGLKPSEEDVERAQLGCISEQLRSDWTHLNSYGYYAKARAVYERGIDLGYWS